MKNPEVKTYGCRLNFYESEVIRKFAKENNLKNFENLFMSILLK